MGLTDKEKAQITEILIMAQSMTAAERERLLWIGEGIHLGRAIGKNGR